MKTLRRNIHPEIRVLDAKKGLVEYVASDESIDSYREVIRAKGWRFDYFKKNAPFVDSHDYSTIEHLLGKVVEFHVRGGKLIETVQWAIDVPENTLAKYGFDMTQAGYLKAVSVGFFSLKSVSRFDGNQTNEWNAQLAELGLEKDAPVRVIWVEQQQIELSACVIGANPNALAKAYKAGVLDDAALDFISRELADREPASDADSPGAALEARRQAREARLEQLRRIAAKL